MCNPRRIRVTATRQLEQAWQTEVSRTVHLQEQVTGEARVRQPLDSTLGSSALRALELALASNSDWTEVEQGYRCEVEGGYVTYLINEGALEIVAVMTGEIRVAAEQTTQLEGVVRREIVAEGEGRYYDDGWRGQTQEVAQKAAETAAQQELERLSQEQLTQARAEAEAQISQSLETAARTQAQNELQQRASQQRDLLSSRARQHLDTVGLRCRQAFHRVLAQAYRDAILAYARRNGAENIQCSEGDNIVEIEFNLNRS